jgi:cell filamentation protein
VTFDPFGDFDTAGYLRNFAGGKDPAIVRRLEHASFLTGLDEAFKRLRAVRRLAYGDVLETHRILFDAVYPWAGQDRAVTSPDIAVSKGSVLFAHPRDARIAVAHALKLGRDKAVMADRPGEVMGYLAYGHPFLDGNGRTIMVVHTELAQRAGISIEWAATAKAGYLAALTEELDRPGRGHLDGYLKPFLRPAVGTDRLAGLVVQAQGLSGDADAELAANQVLGRFSEPGLQARYRHQQERRQHPDTGGSGGPPAKDRQRKTR